MEIKWSDVINWIISNALWELLIVLLILIFIKVIPALFLTRWLLKDNRKTMGNGFGWRRADVFLSLWYKSEKYETKISECFCNANQQSTRTLTFGNIVESGLTKYKLAEIYEDNKHNIKRVKSIKSIRNRIIAQLTKLYLILFIGDNKSYYKNKKKYAK
ncbi:hypothetical protein ACFL3C_04390 [Patescibacteria group bacterium]